MLVTAISIRQVYESVRTRRFGKVEAVIRHGKMLLVAMDSATATVGRAAAAAVATAAVAAAAVAAAEAAVATAAVATAEAGIISWP